MPSTAQTGTATGPSSTTDDASGAVPGKPDFIDEDGTRYIWVSDTVQGDFDPDFVRREERPRGEHKVKRIADMTVQELAAKLRTHVIHDGNEYVLDHDPIEMAEKVLNMLRSGERPPETPGKEPDFDALQAQGIVPVGKASPENIIGADNSISYDHAALSSPASTSLFVQGRGCTATIIGKQMAASAAHCFKQGTVFNGGTGLLIPYNSDTAPTQPYGSFTRTNIYFPGGWTGNVAEYTGDWQFDYAQVRVATNTFASWGWVGTSYDANPDVEYDMWGFPNAKNNQLWKKHGRITRSATCTGYAQGCLPRYSTYCGGRAAWRHDLDILPGDSGAGLLRIDTYKLVAIQSTQHQVTIDGGVFNYMNEARAWDSTTYAYFSSSGIWP